MVNEENLENFHFLNSASAFQLQVIMEYSLQIDG